MGLQLVTESFQVFFDSKPEACVGEKKKKKKKIL